MNGDEGAFAESISALATTGIRDSQRSNGNIINVHQHFNQPNIMNYNHNEFFEKALNHAQNAAEAEQPYKNPGET